MLISYLVAISDFTKGAADSINEADTAGPDAQEPGNRA